VHFGPHRVEGLPLAAHLNIRMIIGSGGRVVAQIAVLDHRVRDVEAEARDTPVVPEAVDGIERGADFFVPPVQVGLRG
jgi:hypothetical protein